MRSYRVGIIGCGPRAQHHAEALRHLGEVEIAGAAEVREDRLGPFCDKWEIPKRYPSAAALLESERLDLVTIPTLPEPHAALVKECAAARVPVINIEKVAAYEIAAMNAAAGIVSTHAQTIRPATPHRTDRARCVAPTPTIDPVIVWVVLTGMPNRVANRMLSAPPASAQNPPTGRNRVTREPIVWTMRQPPNIVPSAIAVWHESTIHSGSVSGLSSTLALRWPAPMSSAAMMPIVFCASLAP